MIDETIIVSNIVLGFSFSMIMYFFGQLSRIFTEIIETTTKR
jgi:hypothetical protein